jgi:hypothetical protein
MDISISRKAVQAIGHLATSRQRRLGAVPSASTPPLCNAPTVQAIEQLLGFLDMNIDFVTSETVVVLQVKPRTRRLAVRAR